MQNIKGWICLRCEHVWKPRKDKRPRACPKCHSAWWDEKRN